MKSMHKSSHLSQYREILLEFVKALTYRLGFSRFVKRVLSGVAALSSDLREGPSR